MHLNIFRLLFVAPDLAWKTETISKKKTNIKFLPIFNDRNKDKSSVTSYSQI